MVEQRRRPFPIEAAGDATCLAPEPWLLSRCEMRGLAPGHRESHLPETLRPSEGWKIVVPSDLLRCSTEMSGGDEFSPIMLGSLTLHCSMTGGAEDLSLCDRVLCPLDALIGGCQRTEAAFLHCGKTSGFRKGVRRRLAPSIRRSSSSRWRYASRFGCSDSGSDAVVRVIGSRRRALGFN
jgi:hypothetical protein